MNKTTINKSMVLELSKSVIRKSAENVAVKLHSEKVLPSREEVVASIEQVESSRFYNYSNMVTWLFICWLELDSERGEVISYVSQSKLDISHKVQLLKNSYSLLLASLVGGINNIEFYLCENVEAIDWESLL